LVDSMLYRLPAIVAFGVAIHLVGHLAAWRSPLPWLRAIVRPGAVLLWLRILLALALLNFAYWWIKISVPLLRVEVFDAGLWRLDQWLHFGVAPAVFAAELVAGTPVA